MIVAIAQSVHFVGQISRLLAFGYKAWEMLDHPFPFHCKHPAILFYKLVRYSLATFNMGQPSRIPRPKVIKPSSFCCSSLLKPVPSATQVKQTTKICAEPKRKMTRTRTAVSSVKSVNVEGKSTSEADELLQMNYITHITFSLGIFLSFISYLFVTYKAYQFAS